MVVFSLWGWSPFLPSRFLVSRRTPDSTRPRVSFVYRSFTFFAIPFQVSQLLTWVPHRGPYPRSISTAGLGCSTFARHYSQNHFCFLFLRVLRCFSSPGSPRITIYSLYDNTLLFVLSSLIRISTDLKIFAPPRSFSQLVTSFFGAMYQGILRKPFVAWSFLVLISTILKFLTRLIRFFAVTEGLLLLPFVILLINQLALLFLNMKNFAFRTRLSYLP